MGRICRTVALIAVVAGMSITSFPAGAAVTPTNGRITFQRYDPTICKGCTSTYTVNPDGTHQKLLLRSTGTPYWSPDGTEISVLADCNFGGPCSATLVDPDTGAVRTLPNPDPALYNEFFSCNRWSPDGKTLACDVVSDTAGNTGLYTIRSSDGGGLTKLISCVDECGATDWSPDGKSFLVSGPDPNGLPVLFVVRVNGTGLRQVSPSGVRVDLENGVASWSPSGDQIVFGGNVDPDHRRSIFVVNTDGSGFHQVPITGCGGAFSDRQSISCFEPGWSPDGSKITFVRSSVMFGTTAIYTANADGSGLLQVTHPSHLGVGSPDWGAHPAG